MLHRLSNAFHVVQFMVVLLTLFMTSSLPPVFSYKSFIIGNFKFLFIYARIKLPIYSFVLQKIAELGGKYEAAVYAAQCSNVKRMLPLCTDWEVFSYLTLIIAKVFIRSFKNP